MTGNQQKRFTKKIVQLFRALGQPARLKILLEIGAEEACVCHLEAMLGMRQAYISQQLMALRKAGLVTSRRDGRNIFYRLKDTELLEFVQHAAQVAGVPEGSLVNSNPSTQPHCCCPHCEVEDSSEFIRVEDLSTAKSI